MLGIGVILLIEALTGSYATAGAVAAVVGVSSAVAAPPSGPVAAPPSGRLVDRFGQARVVIPLTLTHGATLTGMTLRTHHGAPAGRSSPPAARPARPRPRPARSVRARRSHLPAGSGRPHTAFSFARALPAVTIGVGGFTWLRTPVARQ
ncbi:hypothetical protein AB0F88_12420 [Streptosporangium sp. NPDC023963]|uniref:hypothetical protein n=1 Tax=Streptosporangium sp. NPDC023963 TaxID=3155608 RepID=UPI0034267291